MGLGCRDEGEVREMLDAVLEHLGGVGDRPYAKGRCVECGAVHVGWSDYQWAQLVLLPCRSCGNPWCDGRGYVTFG